MSTPLPAPAGTGIPDGINPDLEKFISGPANESRTRSNTIEGEFLDDLAAVYDAIPELTSENEEHPLLTATVLAAITKLLRTAHARGYAEGLQYAHESAESVSAPLNLAALAEAGPPKAEADALVAQFLAGQADAAKNDTYEGITLDASMRARLAVISAFYAGRGAGTEAGFAAFAGSVPSPVHKLWVARFDAKVCGACAALHGMHVPLGDEFPVDTEIAKVVPWSGGQLLGPPRHPRCRCQLVMWFPDLQLNADGLSPFSMMNAAHDIAEVNNWVRATVVYVKPYSRVVNNKLQQVDGYYYDVQSGLKIATSDAPALPTKEVSAKQAKQLTEKSKIAKISGGATASAKFGPGTYKIDLPNGASTHVIVNDDGTSSAISDNKVEISNKAVTQQFLSYWDKQDAVTKLEGSAGSLEPDAEAKANGEVPPGTYLLPDNQYGINGFEVHVDGTLKAFTKGFSSSFDVQAPSSKKLITGGKLGEFLPVPSEQFNTEWSQHHFAAKEADETAAAIGGPNAPESQYPSFGVDTVAHDKLFSIPGSNTAPLLASAGDQVFAKPGASGALWVLKPSGELYRHSPGYVSLEASAANPAARAAILAKLDNISLQGSDVTNTATPPGTKYATVGGVEVTATQLADAIAVLTAQKSHSLSAVYVGLEKAGSLLATANLGALSAPYQSQYKTTKPAVIAALKTAQLKAPAAPVEVSGAATKLAAGPLGPDGPKFDNPDVNYALSNPGLLAQTTEALAADPPAPGHSLAGDAPGVIVVGGVPVSPLAVSQAMTALAAEQSTSVKGPLKNIGSPLASVKWADVVADYIGGPVHYSKLKKEVQNLLADALQKHAADNDLSPSPAPTLASAPGVGKVPAPSSFKNAKIQDAFGTLEELKELKSWFDTHDVSSMSYSYFKFKLSDDLPNNAFAKLNWNSIVWHKTFGSQVVGPQPMSLINENANNILTDQIKKLETAPGGVKLGPELLPGEQVVPTPAVSPELAAFAPAAPSAMAAAPSSGKPPTTAIGGVVVTADEISEAVKLLNQESSTSVKGPLKAAGHPLAKADLKSFAEYTVNGGSPIHYGKLKGEVVYALVTAKSKMAPSPVSQPETAKTTTIGSAPEAPAPELPDLPVEPAGDKDPGVGTWINTSSGSTFIIKPDGSNVYHSLTGTSQNDPIPAAIKHNVLASAWTKVADSDNTSEFVGGMQVGVYFSKDANGNEMTYHVMPDGMVLSYSTKGSVKMGPVVGKTMIDSLGAKPHPTLKPFMHTKLANAPLFQATSLGGDEAGLAPAPPAPDPDLATPAPKGPHLSPPAKLPHPSGSSMSQNAIGNYDKPSLLATAKQMVEGTAYEKVAAQHLSQASKSDVVLWLNHWAKGDYDKAFEIENAKVKNHKGKGKHPGDPKNIANLNGFIKPTVLPAVPGEIPAGEKVPGSFSSAYFNWDEEDYENYLHAANMQNPTGLTNYDRRLWVRAHLQGHKWRVDALSLTAEKNVNNGKILSEPIVPQGEVYPPGLAVPLAPGHPKIDLTKSYASDLSTSQLNDYLSHVAQKSVAKKLIAQDEKTKQALVALHAVAAAPSGSETFKSPAEAKEALTAALDSIADQGADPGSTLAAALKIEQHYFTLDAYQPSFVGNAQTYAVTSEDGQPFIFKVAAEPFRAEVEHGVAELAHLAGFPVAASQLGTFQGKFGQFQRRLDSKSTLSGVSISSLPLSAKKDVVGSHVFDWAVSNDDAAGRNFLLSPNGKRAMPIDLGRSFADFGSPTRMRLKVGQISTMTSTVYGEIYDSIVAGNISDSDTDALYIDSMQKAARTQRVSDDAWREVILAALKNRYNYSTTSASGLEELADQAVARKNKLTEDFDAFWASIYQMLGRERPSDQDMVFSGPLTSGNSPEWHENIAATGASGAATFFAGVDIEDGHLIGQRVLMPGGTGSQLWVSGRLRPSGDVKLRALLDENVDAAADPQVGPSQAQKTKALMAKLGLSYADNTLLKAAKTISYHNSKGDQEYNSQTMSELEALKANVDNLYVQAFPTELQEQDKTPYMDMLNYYKERYDFLNDLVASGGASAPSDLPGHGFQLAPEPVVVPELKVAPKLKVVKKTATYQAFDQNDNNEAVFANTTVDSDAHSGQMYEVTLSDGTIVEYMPFSSTVREGQRGSLRIRVTDYDGSESAAEPGMSLLASAGIASDPATVDDLELLYWRQLYGTSQTRYDRDLGKLADVVASVKDNLPGGAAGSNLAPGEELERWRSAWALWGGQSTLDGWTAERGFLPRFSTMPVPGETVAPAGVPWWQRFDVDVDDLSRNGELLVSSSSYVDKQGRSAMLNAVRYGGLFSTEDRMRFLGRWMPGMSSEADQHKDASHLVYTRQGLSSSGSGYQFWYNPIVTAKTTSFSFYRDLFGNRHEKPNHAFFDHAKLLEPHKHDPDNSHFRTNNELMVKHQISLFDEIEMISYDDPAERQAAINRLQALGVTMIRGLPISARLVMAADAESALAKINEHRKNYTSGQ